MGELRQGAPGELLGLRGQEDACSDETSRLAPRQGTDPPADAQGRATRSTAWQAGIHHRHRPRRRAAGRSGQPAVPGPEPNRLWVADITFVRTWQGFCYTAFVTDACTKKIVGWAVSATMRTEDLPLQAFNHAVWQSNTDLSELVHHSDRGSQYLSLAYTDRLAELGIAPSVGSRGDSYDNALAEAVNAAYKTELINRGRPWRCIDEVELSTAQWVAWYNQERLHEALGYQSPVEHEAALTGTSDPASQPTPALATE